MTTQFVELETINDKELQIACGGKGFKSGKGGGAKGGKHKSNHLRNGFKGGIGFGIGELVVDNIANAITSSDAE